MQQVSAECLVGAGSEWGGGNGAGEKVPVARCSREEGRGDEQQQGLLWHAGVCFRGGLEWRSSRDDSCQAPSLVA